MVMDGSKKIPTFIEFCKLFLGYVKVEILDEGEGVNDWAGEGRIQKTTKKCHEIHEISILTSP